MADEAEFHAYQKLQALGEELEREAQEIRKTEPEPSGVLWKDLAEFQPTYGIVPQSAGFSVSVTPAAPGLRGPPKPMVDLAGVGNDLGTVLVLRDLAGNEIFSLTDDGNFVLGSRHQRFHLDDLCDLLTDYKAGKLTGKP